MSDYDVIVLGGGAPGEHCAAALSARSPNAFLTLLSNGAYLTGAYSLGPEAGEWMQLATPAIRAQVPLAVLIDTIQPLPSFSGIYDSALKELSMSVADMPPAARPMAPRCPAFRPE